MEHFGASTEAVAKYKKMVARSDARQALLRKQELEFDPEDHDGRPNDPKVAKELYEPDQALQYSPQQNAVCECGSGTDAVSRREASGEQHLGRQFGRQNLFLES